jgi:uncharacterized OB-fold protein
MNQPENPSTSSAHDPTDPSQPFGVEEESFGNHTTEIAAREGFGPLTELAETVWHGQSIPCVTCGQLVRRGGEECVHCGQNLSAEMLEKMRAHAGPWYVLEHLRPFPGISLDLIIRQIRRGLITETSIIRGPFTDYQWRYAVETPGICRYFNRCWSCHAEANPADTYCPKCMNYLSSDKPEPQNNGGLRSATSVVASTPNQSDDLYMLTDALNKTPATRNVFHHQNTNASGIKMGWVAAIVSVVVIVGLILITQFRAERSSGSATEKSVKVISESE